MWTGVVLGTIGAASSETWPTVWMMMEVNLMSFLPLISGKWSVKKTCMLYFVVQSVGSLVILSGGVMSDRTASLSKWAITGLLLKTSLAPLHFWGAALIAKISKITSFFFLTWQKIAPMLLILITTPKILINGVLITNLVVAASCAIGSKSILILMFFSGLMHMSWLMAAPFTVGCTYFALYVLASAPIFVVMNSPATLNLPILMMNLAGLPPMTGFLMKLGVLQLIPLSMGGVMLALSTMLLFSYMRVFLLAPSTKGPVKAMTALACCMGALY